MTFVSSIVPARQAARIPPIAAMRSVALERPINRVAAQRDRRRASRRSASLLLLIGPVRRQRHRCVGARRAARSCSACSCSARCSHAASRCAIGAPLTKIKGITGSLARENAARNPRRTATTGAAVMIAVSLVGFITIFAASANASISAAIDQQLKTDYIITSGAAGRRAGRAQPRRSATQIADAARDPGARRRCGSGQVGINERPHVRERDRRRGRRAAVRPRRRRGLVRVDRGQRHRDLEAQGRRQPLEARRHDPRDVREDRRASR